MTMMTAGSDNMYELETVSLNDDDQNGLTNPVLIDNMEAQLPVYANGSSVKSGKHASVPSPIAERDDEGETTNHGRGPENRDIDDEDVVVVVEKPRPVPPTLPPLRVMDLTKQFGPEDNEDGDYVDPTLFSPEVSRQAMDQANRRARSLESELKEMAALEQVVNAANPMKITPLEAVSIISNAFVTSITKVKALVSGQDGEYDLLSGSSPSNKVEDLDTDGDGLQLSPDASKGDGKHFQTPKLKPALKRISAYSSIEKDIKLPQTKPRRQIMWHDDVLDQDEEFVEDDEDEDGESEMLMVNGGSTGNSAIANRQATPRSKKKRKKLVRSMMRRLTPREKEELYRLRPDLMIVPNWAQKYREEMTEAESSRWSFWLISIISTLVVLLVILIMLIARDKASEVKSL